MKKVLKILGVLVVVIVLAVSGLLVYVSVALPNVGDAPDLTIERTPERIERGRYLANSVSVCLDCHSVRDWTKFSGPITPGTFGKGGDRFDQSVGFPGVFYAKNITPFGIERYTDGELYRVITTGVAKGNRAMFPVMPYTYYGRMDDEDIYSIIAYIRTLEPIESEVPDSKPDFPMNFILKTIPKKGEPTKRPEPGDQLAYGAYLANASGCVECHTQVDKGSILQDQTFGGGREFGFPDGSVVRSSNISPDMETGIGSWTQQAFVSRFKMYADSGYVVPSVAPGDFNSIMPWTMYAHMTEEDLSAIYAYLRTVPARSNKVVKFSPPALH